MAAPLPPWMGFISARKIAASPLKICAKRESQLQTLSVSPMKKARAVIRPPIPPMGSGRGSRLRSKNNLVATTSKTNAYQFSALALWAWGWRNISMKKGQLSLPPILMKKHWTKRKTGSTQRSLHQKTRLLPMRTCLPLAPWAARSTKPVLVA